jgi:hypothetical protein
MTLFNLCNLVLVFLNLGHIIISGSISGILFILFIVADLYLNNSTRTTLNSEPPINSISMRPTLTYLVAFTTSGFDF